MMSVRALAIAVAMAAPVVRASTYYVAASGGTDGAGGGTLATPFATIGKAVSTANAGDTIYLLGGTYALSSTLRLQKNGTAALPFTLAAADGASVTLDFAAQGAGQRGVQVEADHWTIRGLVVQNAKDNGVHVSGSNNTIDRLVVRNNGDSGVQLSGSGGRRPANNLVVNTDSYGNYDAANRGENADGFAAKFRELGAGNVFRGVRAWGNSDDGFDFWAAANGVTVENSWSFGNGIDPTNSSGFNGDGNGLKLGHDSGQHVLRNNLVFNNRANGIDVNGNATVDASVSSPYVAIAHGVTILNNTLYNNAGKNLLFDEAYAHVLRNNVSLASGGAITVDAATVADHNSWNGATWSADANDFLSLDASGATGARNADGSLPTLNFLRLKAGSNLIDSGANVGLGFNGAAPDLGAYEFVVAPEPTTIGALGMIGLLARRRRISV